MTLSDRDVLDSIRIIAETSEDVALVTRIVRRYRPDWTQVAALGWSADIIEALQHHVNLSGLIQDAELGAGRAALVQQRYDVDDTLSALSRQFCDVREVAA